MYAIPKAKLAFTLEIFNIQSQWSYNFEFGIDFIKVDPVLISYFLMFLFTKWIVNELCTISKGT